MPVAAPNDGNPFPLLAEMMGIDFLCCPNWWESSSFVAQNAYSGLYCLFGHVQPVGHGDTFCFMAVVWVSV